MGQPNTVQADYRFGENDGEENAHTWIAALHTPIDCGAGLDVVDDEVFFVRFLIQNTGSKSENGFQPEIEYRINGGTWATLGAATPIYYTSSATYLTDGDDTTQRLGTGTFLTENNGVIENTYLGDAKNLTDGYELEVLLVVAIDLDNAALSNNDYIELRVTNAAKALDSYTYYPRIDVTIPTYTLQADRFRIRPHGSYALNNSTDWEAAENADVTTLTPEQVIQIRFGIQETGGAAPGSIPIKYQYSKNGGAWNDLTYVELNGDLTDVVGVHITDNSVYTDGATVSTQLLSGTGTFSSGVAEENATFANLNISNANGCTEHVITVLIRKLYGSPSTGHNATNDYFDFRVLHSDGTEFSGTNDYPRITLATLTGLIGGTMTETPVYIGPVCDSNGNLYCFVERAALPAPVQVAMKSTDGGDYWSPVDISNGPSSGTYGELESAGVVQISTAIHIHYQEDPNAYAILRTSDHATNPDTWESVDQPVNSGGNPADQGCDIAYRAGDGDRFYFYTDVGTSGDSLYYKIYSGTLGGQNTLDDAGSVDYGSPVSIVDANNITHVAYGEHTNNYVYYNWINASDVLQTRTQIMTDGDAANVRDVVPLATWESGGTQYVWIVYRKNADNKLYGKLVTTTTPGSEVGPISSFGVLTDDAGSQCPAATLVQDGVDTYAVYVHETDKDLYIAKSSNGGTWGGETEIKDGVTAQIIPAGLYTHNGGNGGAKVIGVIYADGRNGGTGDVKYTEYEISAAAVGQPRKQRESGLPTMPRDRVRGWN